MDEAQSKILDAAWLVRLRWMATAAQAALVLFAATTLELDIPLIPLFALIGLLAFSNLVLYVICIRGGELSRFQVGSVLVLDTILLYALLFLTGGPSNPFSILFMVYIALAAVVLGVAWTWVLAVIASACFALLFFWHRAVPGMSHGTDDPFSSHLQGMLLAFALTSFLLAYFVSRVAAQLQEKEKHLRELERERMTQLRLRSLATLSAGAAHELATPLSAIAVAAGEIANEISEESEFRKDVDLIRRQVQRCRAVLDQMGASGGQLRAELPTAVTSKDVLDEVLADLVPEDRRKILSEITAKSRIRLSRTGLRQSLLALIRNALDVSAGSSEIRISSWEDAGAVFFEVSDSGPGLAREMLERIGEPFLTTKEPGSGMGLGLFLTKAFVSQSGGSFELESSDGTGTSVRLSFPKERKVVGA